MRASLLLASALLILPTSTPGQGEKADAPKVLRETLELIAKDTGADKEVLMKELQVIVKALPNIENQHVELGIGKEKIVLLASVIWQRLHAVKSQPKLDPDLIRPDKSLTEKLSLVSTRFGYLVVRSTPTGAKVTLRNVDWGTTETENWEEVGPHSIRLEKEGFEILEETIKIKKGKQTQHFVLKKK
jgi:hypothetical protein